MVPFKGRNRFKQYLLAKPRKWGYKLLILSGSDGVVQNFEIYTWRVVQPPELPDVGASGNIVLHLTQPISKEQNHKLFFDNWRQFFDMLPDVNSMDNAELKRTRCRTFEQKIAVVGETTLHVVKWYDKHSVTLLSASECIGASPVTAVERRDGKQKGDHQPKSPALLW